MIHRIALVLMPIMAAIAAPAVSQTIPSQTITKSFDGPAQTIPDVTTTTSNIAIPSFAVNPTKVTVTIKGLKHTYIHDVQMFLVHGATSVAIFSQNCNANINGITVTFDDGATLATCPSATSTIKPNSALSAFNGVSAAGTWTLKIADIVGGDSGSTTGWSLGITYNGYATGYGWTTGSYGAWSATCGTATRTRTVKCVDDGGVTQPEASCGGLTKPDATETSTQTSSCTYGWNSTSFVQTPACGATTDTRTVTCKRSDGTVVADSTCTGTKPPASQTSPTANYDSCTYRWQLSAYGPWSTTCGNATHTRTKTCLRSDGATVPDAQAQSRCGDGPFYTANSFTYAEPLSESQYFVNGCTYAWRTGEWSITPACGATDESRTMQCQRSEGTTVEDASCSGAGAKPATHRDAASGTTNYAGCTFRWIGSAWSPIPPTTCGLATRTRTLSCVRSDGLASADSACPAGRPDTQTQALSYVGCSYSWRHSGYSLSQCVNSTQTYTGEFSCRRNGTGDWVDAGYCTGRQPSDVQTRACTYWQDHANDPYSDALPGDVVPSTPYSPSGGSVGSGQAPAPVGNADDPTGAPGVHSGGAYNPATGAYTAPDGTVLEGGYYDAETNTYWDSPEFFHAWQNSGGTNDVIVMRRVIGKN